jgi:nicotinate-nucleotide--dimethylbenzimidazole phosphoribosyltransferase
MGIGNTSCAAALLVASGLKAEDVVDRGTGISAEALDHKREIIVQAVRRHAPFDSPRTILQRLGGYEIGTIVGFILALRETGVACVIDGFPVSAAAYIAYRIDSSVVSFLFAGHKSKVKGHGILLEAMGLDPILDLEMRLGEGTGAVLGGQIIGLSAKLSGEMASFDSASVSRSDEIEENY